MECQNESPITTMTMPIVMSNFPMNIEVYSAQQSTVLYTIDTPDLLDMHALEPVTFWASGIHIRQITHAYVTTITPVIPLIL